MHSFVKFYSWFFFFFSSRRRHTRSKRDWSSDVCSSDLRIEGNVNRLLAEFCAHLGADDGDIANGERTERKTRLDDIENGGRDTRNLGQVVGIGEDAVRLRVAVIENLPGELLIAVSRVDGEE